MEVAVIVLLMCVVVGAKSLTSVWIGKSRLVLREGESEESVILERLRTVESAKLQLERDKEALVRHETHLVSEKDLLLLEIEKAGVKPIGEEELAAMDAAEDVSASGSAPSGEDAPSGEGVPEGGDPEAKTKAGDAPAEGTEAPAGKAAASQGEARKARVLVVDDNAEFRGLLQQALSKGYEVVGAVDGQDAMAKIREESRGFDVVVTDLKMPNVDGIAFLEGLQEPVPTIVISGFLNRPEFQEALGRLEHVAVLEKPFKMAEMREAIEKALGGKAEKH